MAAIDELKTAWTTLITAQYAADANSISYRQALVDLDTMILAQTAYQTLATSGLSSYSIAGRTVTRQQIPELKKAMEAMRLRLERYCRNGSVSADDFNVPDGVDE